MAKQKRGRGNGTWEQFKPGNTVARTHGAWAEKVTNPVAQELVEIILTQVSYLSDPSYEAALWAWARAEAQVLVVTAYLEEHGELDENGNPRPALSALREFESRAARGRTRLGLDPLSRAQLGRDITAQQVDLARLYSEQED